MTLEQIRLKFPTAHYAPEPDCPRCSGTGLRRLPIEPKAELPCPCIFIAKAGREEALRLLAETSKKIRRELDEQGPEHPMIKTAAKLGEVLLAIRTKRSPQ